MLFRYLQDHIEFLRFTAQESADPRKKLILFHRKPHGGRGPDKQKGRCIKNRVTFNARTVTQ